MLSLSKFFVLIVIVLLKDNNNKAVQNPMLNYYWRNVALQLCISSFTVNKKSDTMAGYRS